MAKATRRVIKLNQSGTQVKKILGIGQLLLCIEFLLQVCAQITLKNAEKISGEF